MNDTNRKWKGQNPILIAYAVLVFFGWWLPNDLLDHSAGLRAFTNAMASAVPQIDRVTAFGGSALGQTNRLLYSVLWAFAMATMPFFAVNRYRHFRTHGFEPELQHMPLWKAFPLLILCLLIALNGFFFYSVDPSLRIIHFGVANRFGIGLMAPMLTFGSVAFLMTFYFLCWGLLTSRISIGPEK